MTMSPRKPVPLTSGFLGWFSTRRDAKSGQTLPVEMRTSDVSGVPLLIPVMSRISGESPCFAQSGTHPLAASAPSTNTMAFALITFLPDRIGNFESLARITLAPVLDDTRRNEQEQLVVRARDEPIAEQVAQDRHTSQEWGHLLGGLLVALVDAADDGRGPVAHEHLRLRGLRVDGRNAVHEVREVGRVVLDVDGQDHRARLRDLRRDLQGEHRVLEADRDGVVGDGLDRDLHALLDLRGLVVLGRDLRRGEKAPTALALQGSEGGIEVEAAEDVAQGDADGGIEARRRQVDRVAAPGRADAGGGGLSVLVRADPARRGHTPAVDDERVGEGQAGRVAELRSIGLVEAPLDAEVTSEVAAGDDDARLDLDLARRKVQGGDEVLGLFQEVGEVVDDQRVRARIDVQAASGGKGARLA